MSVDKRCFLCDSSPREPIVGSFQIMKTRSKLLRALAFIALHLLLLPVIWLLVDALMGGAL